MDFPFDIYQVADILGLQQRHCHSLSSDYDCPFCDGKGKLNLNVQLNVYRCNRCGLNGGMIDLFCRCNNISDRKAAYRMIEQRCNNGFSDLQRKVRQIETKSIKEAEKADIERIDRCYNLMLDELSLEKKHRDNLLSRGLSLEEIQRLKIKSVPKTGYKYLVNQLISKDCNVIGVAGFYTDNNGETTINLHPSMGGFFVPVRNEKGQIQGMQIRLDEPKDKRKYMWLSSSGRNGGCTSGSPVQISGNIFQSEAIYVTEGALKCQIAHYLSDKPFIAVAGVNQYKTLETVFEALRAKGNCKIIVDAFDMDDTTNPYVAQGHQKLIDMAKRYGFTPYRLKWQNYKGIDDFLCAKKRKEQSI